MNTLDKVPKIMCDWDQSNQGWKTLWNGICLVSKFIWKSILFIFCLIFVLRVLALLGNKD